MDSSKYFIRKKTFSAKSHEIHLAFLFNSLCGFRDSLTFQHVDDNQINSVEDFIKTKLPTILSNWKSRENGQAINDEDFFGPVHVFNPSQFEFSPGDRMQINNIAKYVKEKVSDTCVGAQYFDPNKSKTIKPNYKRIGNHFGHTSSTQMNKSTEIDNSEWKIQLFKHAVKFMNKKGINAKKVGGFTESMVSITSNGCNGIEGHIQCILCKSSDGKCETITVQSKMGDHSKLYWTLSNFGKHLNTHFKKAGYAIKPNIDDVENNSISFRDNSDEVLLNSPNTHCQLKYSLDDNENQIHDEIHISEQSSNSTTSLSIEPIDVSTLESLIYNQISDQLIQMKNVTMTHNEQLSEMIFLIGNARYSLHTVKIDANGSCLFGASIHQTLGTKIASTAQSEGTKKLRADVVAHIKKNRTEFKKELEGAALDLWETEARLNLEVACTRFLEVELPKNCTWGGSETIKAITQLKKVNILVINENGDFYYPCRFNTQFEQTIILAYTTYQYEEHEISDCENGTAEVFNVATINRIHYDSVINIEQKDVFSLSKMLASTAYKQMMDKGKTISINDTL